jgi:hypothetical protein
MQRQPLMYGGRIDIEPSAIVTGAVYLGVVNHDGEMTGAHLTPIEAVGLAQALLKAANTPEAVR